MGICGLRKSDRYIVNCHKCGASSMRSDRPKRKKCFVCGGTVIVELLKNFNIQSH